MSTARADLLLPVAVLEFELQPQEPPHFRRERPVRCRRTALEFGTKGERNLR